MNCRVAIADCRMEVYDLRFTIFEGRGVLTLPAFSFFRWFRLRRIFFAQRLREKEEYIFGTVPFGLLLGDGEMLLVRPFLFGGSSCGW